MNGMKRHNQIAAALAVVALALVALSATVAYADDESGGVPGDWLSRYAGARSVGMGGAFVATAD